MDWTGRDVKDHLIPTKFGLFLSHIPDFPGQKFKLGVILAISQGDLVVLTF